MLNTSLSQGGSFGESSLPGVDDLYDPYALKGRASKYDVDGFFEAARMGRKDLVRKLLDSTDINIDDRNEAGFTALMEAVKANEGKIMRILLSRGANVHALDNLGQFASNLCRRDHFLMN